MQLPELHLPPIAPTAHKFSRGSLLILAGSKRYYGAGVLAAKAAERGGAGYVSLATPVSVAPAARTHLVSTPVIEAPETEEGTFCESSFNAVKEALHTVHALCCGPGITVSEQTRLFVQQVLRYAAHTQLPLLLDADALNIIARWPELLQERQSVIEGSACKLNPLILTPHEGELKRLCEGFGIEETKRIQVQVLAHKLSAVVIAKGATTVIAYEHECHELAEATPALAKAGTGDVLAGLLSSLLAQGMQAGDAALLGVRIHSRAGILAEQQQGRRSVTAGDIVESLSQAIREFE